MIFIKKMWIVLQIRFAGVPVVQEEIRTPLDLMPQVNGAVNPSLTCHILLSTQ